MSLQMPVKGEPERGRAREPFRQDGCQKAFRETAGRARIDRRQRGRVLDQCGAGDGLMGTRLDGLARLAAGRLNTLAAITDREARIRALDDAWTDTATLHFRLTQPMQDWRTPPIRR